LSNSFLEGRYDTMPHNTLREAQIMNASLAGKLDSSAPDLDIELTGIQHIDSNKVTQYWHLRSEYSER